MQRKLLGMFLACGLSAAAFISSPDTSRADHRHSTRGPVAPVRAPYYRRYAGPPPARHGSPYYAVANSRIFGPPAAYVPYGAPVAGGYAYPYVNASGYYPAAYPGIFAGEPFASSWPPVWGDWNPYSNPLLQATMLENQLRWGTALPPGYPEQRTRTRVHVSSPEQQAKSLRAQAQGDVWMKKLRFLNAYERYKVAQSAASDRPEPYFRLGFSLASVGNFDSAVKYIKQGLDLDPRWPAHGDRLDTLFGEDNRLSVLTMIERVGGWVREDIRDPDRLFLMGVILHFDGDTRASEFFEAAFRLAGYGDHLLAFLHPAAGPGPAENSPGPVWNGPGGQNPNGPGDPNGAGMPNGGRPAPAPREPREMAPPQMVAPPDFGPPGEPQGLFSQPRQVPRGLYQPLPQSRRPRSPWNGNVPQPPQVPPPGTAQPSGPAQPTDPNVPPQVGPPSTPAPSAPRQNAQPTTPALPLPPLPAPEDPSAEGQPGSPGAPPSDGPALGPPTAGSVGGSTTAQSP